MSRRDDLKEALSYLRRKDPENEVLQSYDRRFGNLTTASEKTTTGSITAYDHWKENYSSEGIKEKQKKSKKSILGSDGSRQSKGYEKEMKKRAENPEDYLNMEHVQKMEEQKKLQEKKDKQQQRVKDLEKRKKQKSSSFLDDILTPLKHAGQALNPFDGVSIKEAMNQNVEDALATDRSKATKEINRAGARIASGATFNALDNIYEKTRGEQSEYFKERDGAGKTLDFLYDMAGFGVSGAGVAKGLGALGLGAKTVPGALGLNAARRAGEGALAGAIASGAEIGIQESLNGDRADWKQNLTKLGLETALGAVGDAGLGAIGDIIRLRKAKGATPQQVAEELKIPVDVVEKEFIKGTLPGQEIVDPNALRLEGPKEEPTRLLGGKVDPQEPLGLNEPLYRRNVEGLGKEMNIEGTPLLNAPRHTPVQADELEEIQFNLQDTFRRRQEEEELFVRSEMKPYDDMLESSAHADHSWQTSKQMKDIATRIKGHYGQIIIPESNWADWGHEIPVGFRAKKGSTKGIDIYTFADNEGFATVDEAIQFLKNIDGAGKTKLKDLKPADDMKISPEQYDELENAARSKFQETDTAKGLDSMFDELNSMLRSYDESSAASEPLSFMQSKLFRQTEEPISYVGRMDPKDQSTIRSEGEFTTRYKETPTGDTLEINAKPQEPLQFRTKSDTLVDVVPRKEVIEKGQGTYRPNKADTVLDQMDPNPTPKVEPEKPEDKNFRLRMNMQMFNDVDAPTSGLFDTDIKTPMKDTAIDRVKNPISRMFHSWYESYANRFHSASVAEKQMIDQKYAPQLEAAKGNKELTDEIKRNMEREKGFEKALQNESSAAYATEDFLNRHLSGLKKAVGSDEEFSQALEYMVLKDLQWNRDKGIIKPDFKIAEGWDWDRANGVINAGDQNPKFKKFAQAFGTMTQEWRDTLLESGQITKAQYDALGQNPFYIPKHRVQDGLTVGGRRGDMLNKRNSDELILDELGSESVDGLFKNPLEAIIQNSFLVHNNALKNDTFIKAYDMAKLDDEGALFQEITKAQYNKFGGLKGKVNGEEKYLKVQDDILAMMEENDSFHIKGLSDVTRWMAHLKTSSLEHQITAAPRDIAQGMVTSQIKDPFTYMWRIAQATFNRDVAKEMGATFGKEAFTEGHNVNPEKVLKAYAKQHGNVKVFNPKDKESWKELAGALSKIVTVPYKVVTTPGRKIGQWSDEVVRQVEVDETKRVFMKKHGKAIKGLEKELIDIENRLASVEGIADEFDPRLQGIQDVANRKVEVENELRKYQQDLKREQIYRGRDVMNYSRVGRNGFVKFIRSNVMFANTTTQSKDKILRSFIERPVSTGAKMAAVTAPFVAAQKIMMDHMSSEDRKIYEETPGWMKQSNYVFVHNGNVYTLPKVHELALITNPIEAAMAGESLSDSMKYIVKELTPYQLGHITQGLVEDEEGKTLFDRDPMTKNMMGVTAPPLGPTQPIADLMFNDKTGFNRKPISYSSEKANKWTTEAARAVAGDTPNADALEYLVRQYGGDVGKYLTYGADAALGLDELGDTKKARIDALLQNLNPLQDRIYHKDNRFFKSPMTEEKKK